MRLKSIVIIVFTAAFFMTQNNLTMAGMGVAPSKIQLTIDPGSQGQTELYIMNDSGNKLEVALSVWDFARDRNGRPFPVYPEEVKTFRGCGNWVTFHPKILNLNPGQTSKVQIKVEVPANADLGTYYTYVQVRGTPLGTQDNVFIKSQINALLLVTAGLPGDVTYIKRALYAPGIKVKRINYSEPVGLTPTIENKGNYHANLEGNILIRQGKKVIEKIPVKECTLLPKDTLQINKNWEDPPLLGKFTAHFIGKIQGLDKVVAAKSTFWVISGKLVTTVASALAIMLIAGLMIRRKYRLR